MGDTDDKSWTGRELGIHIAKKESKMTINEQTAEKITEALANLSDKDSIKEGVEKLSGLPNEFIPVLTAMLAAKNGIEVRELSDKIAHFVFDTVLVSLAIGFAEGKRQGATANVKAASESIS